MIKKADQEIYFHVGLGKVASTYLQRQIFPKLEGIHYIPTRKYKISKQIIPELKRKKVLVSREFDRQFEREVSWFTRTYPNAGIIILLRRHDSWIASQYRRHVKNGWYHEFEDFFDLEEDQGLWKKRDLLFYPKLEMIEKCSRKKPLVLFYNELEENPRQFLEKITAYTGTRLLKNDISFKAIHRSYGEKQLKFLRVFCRKFVKIIPEGHSNKVKHWLLYRPFWLLFHLILYLADFIPERFITKKPLINGSSLQKIKKAYAEDWRKVVEYAQQNNLMMAENKESNS